MGVWTRERPAGGLGYSLMGYMDPSGMLLSEMGHFGDSWLLLQKVAQNFVIETTSSPRLRFAQTALDFVSNFFAASQEMVQNQMKLYFLASTFRVDANKTNKHSCTADIGLATAPQSLPGFAPNWPLASGSSWAGYRQKPVRGSVNIRNCQSRLR